MKKTVFVVFCALFMLMMQSQVFASSSLRQEILNELSAGVKVGDNMKYLPDKYLKLAADFLNTSGLTESEMRLAQREMQEVKSIWISTGKENYSEMPYDVQMLLQNKAIAAAASVGATLSFDGKVIVVTTKDGRVYSVNASSTSNDYAIRYPGENVPVYPGESVIKVTGIQLDFTSLYTVASFMLCFLGLTFMFARKYNFNEG